MGRKKHGAKKNKTYRPKFAKKENLKKMKQQPRSIPTPGAYTVPRPASEIKRTEISKEKLPPNYDLVDNQAYRFPPFGYVVVMALLIGFVAYLLF